ncbi:MAG TPA: hypothetical protein PLE45_12880 [Spirochaetota bacterium]|nr:hypothetical protein [Spirochaetota bacterium]HOL56432.1 hypothetical protein [Spirochaetota bacterium]HPP05670.1 hypothetical protein [Spirochaetota bacterium]
MKRILYIVSILIFLNSCLLTSKNPLGKIEDAISDDKLIGLWQFKNLKEKESGYLLIFRNNDKSYELIVFDSKFKSEEILYCYAYISEIDRERYFNIKILQREGHSLIERGDDYIFSHYKIKNGTLIISLFNEDFIKKAILENKLQGSVDNKFNSILITDTTENIINLIKNSSLNDLLDKEKTYQLKKIK